MKKQLLITLALTVTLLKAEALKNQEIQIEAISESNSSSGINPHNSVNNNPYYEGEVMTVEQAGAYTYLEIKEKTEKTFWIAVSAADAKVKDYVRFQMELVTKNFKSKALNKTFDEVMFASGLQHRVIQEFNDSNKTEETPKIDTH